LKNTPESHYAFDEKTIKKMLEILFLERGYFWNGVTFSIEIISGTGLLLA
jgi:hypothetical protein